ncbi:MAG: sulfotransferase domain-containing protein [Bacteroidetes bacterium]|nr:sulfotransferase domain-containing protein [Bacteroidota bacterium]
MPETRKNIVWLASYPKSGNTWFRIFLSNLLSDSHQPVNINNLTETTISSNRSIIDSFLGIHSSELSAEEIDNLRPQVFRRFSDEMEETAYVKTHEAWTLNSRGFPLFPKEITKGVLYIVRNPLDIAISYSYHNNASIDETISVLNSDSSSLNGKKYKIDIQTQQILKSWSNHVNSWTENSKLPVHVIRYEDMLDHSLNTFKRASDFLNLEYEESEIKDALARSSFDTLKAMETETGFRERGMHSEAFFRKGRSNEWETGLTKQQIKDIVEPHHKVMKKFGYLKES